MNGNEIYMTKMIFNIKFLLVTCRSVLGELNESRHSHAVVIIEDRLYVIGGTMPYSIEMYDEYLKIFSIQAELPMRKFFANALCYKNWLLFPCGELQVFENWPAMTAFNTVSKEIKHIDLELSQNTVNYAVLINHR